MSTVIRDTFIYEMEDNLKEVAILGFNQARKWERVYRVEKTDKRRVEMDTAVHPSVVSITKEGGQLNRLTVRRGWLSYVVPDTLTGEVKVTHEFMRDNRYSEIERDSFGLGKAMQRKRYKDACSYLYNGFSSVLAPDQNPVFYDQHTLVNGNGAVGDNLLTAALNSDSLEDALALLAETVDENGDIVGTDLSKIQLIVPFRLVRTALKLVGSSHEPENMNNGVNVYSGSFGEYNIEVVCLELLREAPDAFRDTQWYLRMVSEAQNVFYEREEPETWLKDDTNSLSALHQCKDAYGIVWHDWRYVVGSKGLA